MIESSELYKAAISADARRTLLRAAIDIIDPDITMGEATTSDPAPFSKAAQLTNKKMSAVSNYATLEHNRWLLNGSFKLIPDDNNIEGEVGYVSKSLCGADRVFATKPWAQINFDNVSILQACSVVFPDAANEGIADEFTVEVFSGSTAYFTQTVSDNRETQVFFEGFTVYNPTAIRITISKWSKPYRRARIPEIVPGVYEEWNNDIIAAFSVTQRGDVSCMSIPYGSCTLKMDNLSRRFEPRSKTGVFQSIEERQGIDIQIGVKLDEGEEYRRVGVFYQHSGGWRTGDNGITMTWQLVDIVGLLANRTFVAPAKLPTTLGGWIAALAAQLGDNFVNRYKVDPNYESMSCKVNSAADIADKNCGDILRWVCMATGTWPRADASTGFLCAEPLWSQGNKLDLDNLNNYPVMKANPDVGALVFELSDGTEFVVSGTAAASSNAPSIKNPFIHTQAQALTAARNILSTYGGNQIETTGRGDPSSEIGDVDTVWLNESVATTGRRILQTFDISGGVMQGCKSTLLQADGSFMFEEFELITKSGTWTAPAGVNQLRLIIGQGGQGGMRGQDGYARISGMGGIEFESISNHWGEMGNAGHGGKIWYGTININNGQSFAITIGKGGAPSSEYGKPGAEGGESTFGDYTSANGSVYPLGFTDIGNGNSYGRTGVAKPLAGSGDGGRGGNPGTPPVIVKREAASAGGGDGAPPGDSGSGNPTIPEGGAGNAGSGSGSSGSSNTKYEWYTYREPGLGGQGSAGGSGFVAIWWDKPEVSA